MYEWNTNKWMRGICLFLLGVLTVFLISNSTKAGCEYASGKGSASACETCVIRESCPTPYGIPTCDGVLLRRGTSVRSTTPKIGGSGSTTPGPEEGSRVQLPDQIKAPLPSGEGFEVREKGDNRHD